MQAQEKAKYVWWERRLARAFQLYDETRIDHFRGFAGNPADFTNATCRMSAVLILLLPFIQAFGQ